MNFSFNRRTELALAAIRTLASSPGRMTRVDLAREIGTTASYLPQVMSPLIDGGWIRSGRGPGGGYELSNTASDLRLLEVVEATEGPTDNGRCVLNDGPCPGEETCPIHAVWLEARRVLIAGFEQTPALTIKGDQT